MRVHPLLPALTFLVAGGAFAQEPAAKPASPVPAAAIPPELAKALAKASVHNQRVLVVFAADGRDVLAELKKDRTLSRPLLYEFESLSLQGDAAHAFAVQHKLQDALVDRPALAVLDAAGKALATVRPAQFLGDGKVAGKQLLDLLQPLYCAPVDAEVKLAASLAESRKTGRPVFVRFDAPW